MDFNYGQHVQDTDWVDAIQIISPLCRSEVQGKVEVQFKAKGMMCNNFSRFLFCSNECICKISWRFTINSKKFF